MKNFTLLCFCSLFLTSCETGKYEHYLNLYDIKPPQQQKFTHCFNYGCQTRHDIALPHKTIQKIHNLFDPPAKNPTTERNKISKAIQIFEKDIGALTGTQNDKNGTFRLYQDNAATSKSFQQDCIDESTNTTIYLALLENMNLLKFYKPAFPASRQPFMKGARWWHQTAVIEEKETGKKYAVDSWFFDNGAPASVISLKKWKDGWHPKRKNKK